MRNFLKVVLLTMIFTQIGLAQKNYEDSRDYGIDVVGMTQLKDLKYADGIIFYLGKDKQTIFAKQNNKILWASNIISICGRPLVGKPKIRKTYIKENSLILVYGKHSFAKINIISGHETCLGSD
jgi:hypothetical protein